MTVRAIKPCLAAFIVFLGLIVGISAAHAGKGQMTAENDPEDLTEITAKKVTVRPCSGGREIVFEGKVKAKQRDITLVCDRLIVLHENRHGSAAPGSQNKTFPIDWQTDSTVKTITALGNVKITQKDRTATAGKAIYDHAKRTVTLTEGPPRFWQGRDSGMADSVVMYLDENRFELFKPDFKIKPGEQKKENKK
jgi:lipopolysaccharide export system protein LptA